MAQSTSSKTDERTSGDLPDVYIRREACPLCSAQSYRIHHDFEKLPVVRCDACGFLFSLSILADDAMAEFYSGFASARYIQGQEVNAAINIRALRRLVDLRDVHTVLDVGAGYGFLLKRLRDQGITGVGVEPSPDEAKYGAEQLGVDIRPCLLGEAGLPEASFDLAISFEVIEHAPDPGAFVAEMATYVRHGGLVLIATDNFESRVVRAMGPVFPKWIPDCHISHLGPDSLKRCMHSAGLRIENVLSYTPWENWVQYLLMMAKRKPTARECFTFRWPPDASTSRDYPLYGLRRRLTPLWFSMTGRYNLRGSMMFMLARKP